MPVRRRFAAVVFAILALIAVSAPSFAWKFVSMADSRGSNNGVNTRVLNRVIDLVNSENADLVIFQGDAVGGSSDNAKLASQLDTWLSIMKKLNCPWYFTVGNHEVKTAQSEDVIRSKVDMPLNGPPGYEETVYSFNHKNAHFVALNSNHYGQNHRVQLGWLKADLAKTKQPHVFVMTHEPAYPRGPHRGSSLDARRKERDELWSIMSKGRVSAFFCGHEHLYARSKHGSIYQVINGSCGAPLYTGYAGTKAEYQYVVFDIDGYKVTCTAKNDSGKVIDSWSYSVPAPTAQ